MQKSYSEGRPHNFASFGKRVLFCVAICFRFNKALCPVLFLMYFCACQINNVFCVLQIRSIVFNVQYFGGNMEVRFLKDKLIVGILAIVIGILVCINGPGLIQVVLTLAGVYLIMRGIIDLINKFINLGCVEIAGGVIVIVFAWWIYQVALILLGLLLIYCGIRLVISKRNTASIITGLLMLTVGVFLGLCAIDASWGNILYYILGGILILYGIANLVQIEKKD